MLAALRNRNGRGNFRSSRFIRKQLVANRAGIIRLIARFRTGSLFLRGRHKPVLCRDRRRRVYFRLSFLVREQRTACRTLIMLFIARFRASRSLFVYGYDRMRNHGDRRDRRDRVLACRVGKQRIANRALIMRRRSFRRTSSVLFGNFPDFMTRRNFFRGCDFRFALLVGEQLLAPRTPIIGFVTRLRPGRGLLHDTS